MEWCAPGTGLEMPHSLTLATWLLMQRATHWVTHWTTLLIRLQHSPPAATHSRLVSRAQQAAPATHSAQHQAQRQQAEEEEESSNAALGRIVGKLGDGNGTRQILQTRVACQHTLYKTERCRGHPPGFPERPGDRFHRSVTDDRPHLAPGRNLIFARIHRLDTDIENIPVGMRDGRRGQAMLCPGASP